MNKIGNIVFTFIVSLLAGLLLLGLVKGKVNEGSFAYQAIVSQEVGSPFDSSGSTSRYLLTQAIVEDETVFFNTERAKLASPDVSEYEGKYFSLFNPGVSFIGIPFYLLGEQFNISQLITYLSTTFIALLNALLVARIAKKLGAGFYKSLLSGLIFLFGTNALAYSLTFSQHHASTLVILLATLLAIGERSLIRNICFGILYGGGLLIDIPNGIIMLPLAFYLLYKHFAVKSDNREVRFSLKLSFIGVLLGILPLIGILGWYNKQLTGSYINLPQFVGRSKDFWESEEIVGNTDEGGEIEANLPLKTRNQPNGFSTFLFGRERGIPVYAPIVLLGVIGFYPVYKRKETVLISSVILTNIVIYMLFNDPTGSWSFGPRYLIPGIALLSAGLGNTIEKFKSNRIFMLSVLLILTYSISVNVLGAMTTNMVPPKDEAISLANPVPYTYKYNWQLMMEDELNSSLFYNIYFSGHIFSFEYLIIFTSTVLVLMMVVYSIPFLKNRQTNILENID